jgi:hypothetical protein
VTRAANHPGPSPSLSPRRAGRGDPRHFRRRGRLGSTPIGPNLECRLSPQPTQTAGRFRLRNDYFACELKNFACETILFRPAPRKLLKLLGHEISEIAASCNFKGLRPIFFALFFAVRFPIPPVVLVSISFLRIQCDSTNSIPGKAKMRVLELAPRTRSRSDRRLKVFIYGRSSGARRRPAAFRAG